MDRHQDCWDDERRPGVAVVAVRLVPLSPCHDDRRSSAGSGGGGGHAAGASPGRRSVRRMGSSGGTGGVCWALPCLALQRDVRGSESECGEDWPVLRGAWERERESESECELVGECEREREYTRERERVYERERERARESERARERERERARGDGKRQCKCERVGSGKSKITVKAKSRDGRKQPEYREIKLNNVSLPLAIVNLAKSECAGCERTSGRAAGQRVAVTAWLLAGDGCLFWRWLGGNGVGI